jgi:hypothetical protein
MSLSNLKESAPKKPLFKGRPIENISVTGIDSGDHPKYCDAYFETAFYADTGEELTEDELNELADEQPELLYEHVMDAVIGAGEARADALEDR